MTLHIYPLRPLPTRQDIKSGNFVIKDVNGITLFQVCWWVQDVWNVRHVFAESPAGITLCRCVQNVVICVSIVEDLVICVLRCVCTVCVLRMSICFCFRCVRKVLRMS